MVDVEGNEAKLCVCPLCGEWQKYIARLYARYAELEPSILWVEDDFRLHNHGLLYTSSVPVSYSFGAARPCASSASKGSRAAGTPRCV